MPMQYRIKMETVNVLREICAYVNDMFDFTKQKV